MKDDFGSKKYEVAIFSSPPSPYFVESNVWVWPPLSHAAASSQTETHHVRKKLLHLLFHSLTQKLPTFANISTFALFQTDTRMWTLRFTIIRASQ